MLLFNLFSHYLYVQFKVNKFNIEQIVTHFHTFQLRVICLLCGISKQFHIFQISWHLFANFVCQRPQKGNEWSDSKSMHLLHRIVSFNFNVIFIFTNASTSVVGSARRLKRRTDSGWAESI